MDATFQASIHGIDLKGISQSAPDPVELSEEQKTILERQRAQSLARIQRRVSPNG